MLYRVGREAANKNGIMGYLSCLRFLLPPMVNIAANDIYLLLNRPSTATVCLDDSHVTLLIPRRYFWPSQVISYSGILPTSLKSGDCPQRLTKAP